jgi:hypothetical protein
VIGEGVSILAADALRTQTAEMWFVEEGGERPRRRDELAAQKPLRAPRHHTPPDGSNSLGDKRSPVQIRAPRLPEKCGLTLILSCDPANNEC